MSAALASSEALHERVRSFAQRAAAGLAGAAEFDALALDIARHQAEHGLAMPGYGRDRGAPPISLDQVPALPADVFRRVRVACHAPEQDVVRFRTSGTTKSPGEHVFRTLETYRALCLLGGRRAFGIRPGQRVTVAALAEPFEPRRSSSLGYMMQEFMRELDGREGALERWLVREGAVDVAGLQRAVGVARERGEPLLLLATSFALGWLLEELGGARLELPAGSLVMQTGGFKGHQSRFDPLTLTVGVVQGLGLPAERVIGEYGMTELSSQLYDRGFGGLRPSAFVAPPWLRVRAVDPLSFEPVAAGEVGLAEFTDLGNVDSALRVMTRDRIRMLPEGIVLLGREEQAPARGCSLAIESLRAPGLPGKESAARTGSPHVAATRDAAQRAGARARIERLLAVSRHLVRPGAAHDALCARLVESSGLSLAGVRWALEHCLELEPLAAELDELIERVPAAPQAHVSLPANVFVAAHRALALALAAAPAVFVKPSRREAVWVDALSAVAPDLFTRVQSLEVAPGDAVFAYGSDVTLEAVRSELPAGAVLHAHGDGFGVAVVDLREAGAAPSDRHSAIAGLVEDTLAFDQRGCLSPRLVLALGSAAQVRDFASELARALGDAEARVPRGMLDASELRAAAWQRRCALAEGPVFEAGQGWVSLCEARALLPEDAELWAESLPPAGRHLAVGRVDDAAALLGALEPWLTTVGCSSAALRDALAPKLPRARVVRLGQMQRPRFDGPVDLRPDRRGEIIGADQPAAS